jgi:hypothetical protein
MALQIQVRISNHFSLNVGPAVSDMPVTLPPGRAKLATNPEERRSGVVAMIGIVDVPAINARVT